MFSNSHEFLTSADVNRKELLCIIIPHLKELSENLIVISLRMRILGKETCGSTIPSQKISIHGILIPVKKNV